MLLTRPLQLVLDRFCVFEAAFPRVCLCNGRSGDPFRQSTNKSHSDLWCGQGTRTLPISTTNVCGRCFSEPLRAVSTSGTVLLRQMGLVWASACSQARPPGIEPTGRLSNKAPNPQYLCRCPLPTACLSRSAAFTQSDTRSEHCSWGCGGGFKGSHLHLDLIGSGGHC